MRAIFKSFSKRYFIFVLASSVIAFFTFSHIIPLFASPPTSPYSPGETLDPSCSPLDVNCTVSPPVFGTGTLGRVMFWGASSSASSSENLYWDPQNLRLGIGTTTPLATLDLRSSQTSGTILALGAPSAVTLTGALVGQSIDLSTNYAANSQSITGSVITLPVQMSLNSDTFTGLSVTGNNVRSQNGTNAWYGINVATPWSTRLLGSISSIGLNVNINSLDSGSNAVIEKGINVAVDNDLKEGGTVYGIHLSDTRVNGLNNFNTTYGARIDGPWDYGIYQFSGDGTTQNYLSSSLGIGTVTPGAKLEVVGDIISKGTDWTARLAAGDNDDWLGVAYGNGLFVAVGDVGDHVMTSPDGINWTARSAAGNDDNWNAVAYGNGLFVAVGDDFGDRIMTSPDGINWTARSAAGNDDNWRDIVYGNGLFVSVGDNGDRVITSPDGINWTARSASGNDDIWQGITYGNGLFVAVGDGSDRVITSQDGINWTARSAVGDDDNWRDIVYGNGLFVAAGWNGDRIITSPDGINWTARSAAGDDDEWMEIAYGNGLFVAVSRGVNDFVMTSPNGINWTTRSAAGNDDFWQGIAYGNGVFVAVGANFGERVMTSGKIEQSALIHSNNYQGGMNIFGNVGIGTTTPTYRLVVGDGTTQSDVLISNGGLCVDNNNSGCPANPTPGIVYASSTSITGIDIAENYPTQDASIESGDLVSLDSENSENIIKASLETQKNLIGVISTAPGVLLGKRVENAKPVGLSGRVPVKVNMEGGGIAIGDPLTISSVPGVAKKATTSGRIVGYALNNFSGLEEGEITIFLNVGYWKAPEESASSSGSSSSLIDSLKEFGLYIKNELLEIKNIIADTIFARKIITENLEMKDRDNGDVYCVGIRSGEWEKTLGQCDTPPPSQNTPNENTSPEEIISEEPTSSSGGEAETETDIVNPVATSTEPDNAIITEGINQPSTTSVATTTTISP